MLKRLFLISAFLLILLFGPKSGAEQPQLDFSVHQVETAVR